MRMLRHGLLCAAILGMSAAPGLAQGAPQMTGQEQTYDLLFRNGTLDDIQEPLAYSREVTNGALPDAAARDTGTVALEFEDGGDGPRKANLTFYQDGKRRNLGAFPASVGNPMIMYFVETVVRDMAETAGGSPFYIRNRVKDALVEPAEIEDVTITVDGQDIAAQAVTLRPFEGDPNADRMMGFDDLALTVTMAEDVPGWYHSLAARTEGPDADGQGYSSVITLTGQGDGAAQ